MRDGGELWSELGLQQFLAEFADPRLEQLVKYWLALSQEEAVPRRGIIDPAKFHESLSMVWLMERHEDGHYRYRLAGQAISEIHGGIRRGTDTASLFTPQSVNMFKPRWEAVLDRGNLVRAEGFVLLSDGEQMSRVERLMLPLRGDDGSVSVILGATCYEGSRGPGLTTTGFPPTSIQCYRLDSLSLDN
jgi:hypothetical protein